MTLLTEKEAAEKWCPMAVNSTQMRGDSGRALPECIGSRCMAWRWGLARNDSIRVSEHGVTMPSPFPATLTVGYCGAFGKVEP